MASGHLRVDVLSKKLFGESSEIDGCVTGLKGTHKKFTYISI